MTRRRTSTGDAPLFAWGDALRTARTRRRRLIRAGAAIVAGAGALALTISFPPAPRLVWNASASAPIGLYAVSPGEVARRGDMVIARLAEPWRALAARRRYLPANVPLVKRAIAVAGDEVCALGRHIFVDGRWLADRKSADARGRPMPMWRGCVRLRGRQLFLLMDHPDSFDGRYFGVTQGSDVVGKAVLLWRR
ncbi:MAG TPA: S26 family signal peptidase [Sphingomonas sp.]|nr:S26 family signal peptidase [Sphingomonas sp.]